MKTIEDLALEYVNSTSITFPEEAVKKAFKKGVEIAHQWISVERDKDGLISSKQEKEFINNLPFLIKSKYNIQVIEEMTMDLEKTNYTYWRPIELK